MLRFLDWLLSFKKQWENILQLEACALNIYVGLKFFVLSPFLMSQWEGHSFTDFRNSMHSLYYIDI